MKIIAFAIFDSATKSYQRPFFTEHQGAAIRSFKDIANDRNHDIGRHPKDYTLFRLGQYDQTNGQLMPETPEALANALTLVDDDENNPQNIKAGGTS